MTKPTNSEAVASDLAMLTTFCDSSGQNLDYATAKRALQEAYSESDGNGQGTRVLQRAGEAVGLRITTSLLGLDAVLDSARPDVPIATQTQSSKWFVVLSTKGHRLCVLENPGEPGRWISRSEALQMLDIKEVRQPLLWLSAERSLPVQEVGGHGELSGHGPHDVGHHATPFRRLLRLFHAERVDIGLVFAFSAAVGVLMLATPIAVQALVNNIAFGVLLTPVIVLSLLLFAFLTLAAALKALQTWVVEILQRRIFARVVADLTYRLPRVRYDAFDREHGPELVNRFFDVLTVQKASASLLLDGLAIILQAGIGLAILAFYHPFLLGFDLALLTAIVLLVFVLGRGATDTSIHESIAKYEVASWLEEMARHPLAFRLSGGHEFAFDRADSLTRDYLNARKAHFRVLFRQIAFALFLQALASTALLAIGGWLVIQGQLTIGQLVAAELIVTTIVGSVTKLGKHMESYYDLLAAVDKLGHLIDLPMERDDGSNPSENPAAAGARLVSKSLEFHYEDGPPVLQKLDMDIAAGERVAVVGLNGCGKSTLVDLIFGLRTPTGGRLEIDGVDLREIRLSELRDRIAAVKGCEIVDASVYDNVRMGREAVSSFDVRWAIEVAGLSDEIRDFPMGIRTRLTTGGAPLSNSQARRVALARALAGRPSLLVVDETLDGMDDEIRDRVMDSLFAKTSPWTLLVVSHDQRTIDRCDRTISLERNR